jgi:flagellar assembly factor FliW
VVYNIPEESKKSIQLTRDEDLLVLNLVSFKRGKDVIRFHMRSPLLFNTATRVGCQLVLNTEELQKCVKLPAGLEWVDDDDDNA